MSNDELMDQLALKVDDEDYKTMMMMMEGYILMEEEVKLMRQSQKARPMVHADKVLGFEIRQLSLVHP
jgi:hypothetical protein